MPKRQSVSYTSQRRWTTADARAALDAQARSGLSVQAFAAREGLDAQRLLRWERRLTAKPASSAARKMSPTFVEIAGSSSASVEIVLRSGRLLRVSESIDPSALRRLVEALDEGSC